MKLVIFILSIGFLLNGFIWAFRGNLSMGIDRLGTGLILFTLLYLIGKIDSDQEKSS